MILTLHPTYIFRVRVQRPDPTPADSASMSRGPFWDSIDDKNRTGCDEVMSRVRSALQSAGLGNMVRVDLEKFDHQTR